MSIEERHPRIRPAGQDRTAWLTVLEQGANLIQSTAPLKDFDVYVVGFHPAEGEPDMQMEAHHYCRVVNDDLLQCVLFDGNTRDADPIGVEYIVSGRSFDTLPEQEKPYWHPHHHEVFSGQLVAPGLPQAVETSLMKQLVNSYGKTWHTWHTRTSGGHEGMGLPLGDPMLMWAFNRDGEADEALLRERNEAMGLDVDAKRAARGRTKRGPDPEGRRSGPGGRRRRQGGASIRRYCPSTVLRTVHGRRPRRSAGPSRGVSARTDGSADRGRHP